MTAGGPKTGLLEIGGPRRTRPNQGWPDAVRSNKSCEPKTVAGGAHGSQASDTTAAPLFSEHPRKREPSRWTILLGYRGDLLHIKVVVLEESL
jgi:hypothetical protein